MTLVDDSSKNMDGVVLAEDLVEIFLFLAKFLVKMYGANFLVNDGQIICLDLSWNSFMCRRKNLYLLDM